MVRWGTCRGVSIALLVVAAVARPPIEAVAGAGECTGDCSGDGLVGVDELVAGVEIALGRAVVETCAAFDRARDGAVGVDDLTEAVRDALFGCGGEEPTATPSASPSAPISTGTVTPTRSTPTASSATPTPTSSPTATVPPTMGTPTATATAFVPIPTMTGSTTPTDTSTPSGALTITPPPTSTGVTPETPTPTATPPEVASATSTIADTKTPTATATQTGTPTASATATPSDVPSATPTSTIPPSATPTPTEMPSGPIVTYLALVKADGRLVDPADSLSDGTPVFVHSQPQGFLLVIEAGFGTGNRPIGGTTFNHVPGDPNALPDLQIVTSCPLGDGSPAVCDAGPGGPLGGVPAVDPPLFGGTQASADAINDFACRFSKRGPTTGGEDPGPCTRNENGEYAFADPGSRVQFCSVVGVGAEIAFKTGDTRITARITDTSGEPGPAAAMVVRIVPE
jgi:hypothetical protein